MCLTVQASDQARMASLPVSDFVGRHGLANEYAAREGHPTNAVAFIRRIEAMPADIADDALLNANAVVHVASPVESLVAGFCAELAAALGPAVVTRVLSGVVRPPSFTGGAMHDFAYAHQVTQQPGDMMPNAFLLPMSKTPEWWTKTWMERHTYFLPRYDDQGHQVAAGHALAAAAGIPHLLRRTYRNVSHPAPSGTYDFVNYFECAADGVPIFRNVCAHLRDVEMNPEWRYVREGPTWHGLRVASWPELFA